MTTRDSLLMAERCPTVRNQAVQLLFRMASVGSIYTAAGDEALQEQLSAAVVEALRTLGVTREEVAQAVVTEMLLGEVGGG